MLLDIVYLFMALALVLIYFGYQYKSIMMFLMASIIIFTIGVAIMTNDLQYKSGSTISDVNATSTVVTDVYTNYQNHYLGLFLAVLGFLIFAFTLYDIKNLGRENK